MKYTLKKKEFEKPKKQFGSGTKGRLDSFAYDCREAIKKHCTLSKLSLDLANEYITDIQKEFGPSDNRNWQRWETVPDAIAAFKLWLSPPPAV